MLGQRTLAKSSRETEHSNLAGPKTIRACNLWGSLKCKKLGEINSDLGFKKQSDLDSQALKCLNNKRSPPQEDGQALVSPLEPWTGEALSTDHLPDWRGYSLKGYVTSPFLGVPGKTT